MEDWQKKEGLIPEKEPYKKEEDLYCGWFLQSHPIILFLTICLP